MEEHWEALVAVAVTNASTRAIGAVHDRIMELEGQVARVHRVEKRLRAMLAKIQTIATESISEDPDN